MKASASTTSFGRFVDSCQQLVGLIEANRGWRTAIRHVVDQPFQEFSEPERAVAQTILLNIFTKAVLHRSGGKFAVPYEAGLLLANGALREGFAYLLHTFDSCSREQAKERLPIGVTDPRLRPGLDYLHHRYSDAELNLADTARQSNLSKWYFDRLLKKVTGTSFRDHLRAIRMTKARQLLESTSLEVKEVAGRVGYRHASHFSRNFKRHCGVSASEHRRLSSASGESNSR